MSPALWMCVVIDQMDGDFAAVELPSRDVIVVERALLPPDSKEGASWCWSPAPQPNPGHKAGLTRRRSHVRRESRN